MTTRNAPPPASPLAASPRRGAVRLRWLQPRSADATTRATWAAALSREELDRAARFRFDADRDAFLAAHALLRGMLSEQAARPAKAWRFVAGQAGKPELDPAHGLPWLRFNLSHARSLVACAVAIDDEIGIDVECLDRRAPTASLAARWFAPEEVRFLDHLAEPARTEAFLRLWTLKEAFVKATGAGIALGIERVVFALDPPRLQHAPAECGAIAAWRFLQVEPVPRHVLAVARRQRRFGDPVDTDRDFHGRTAQERAGRAPGKPPSPSVD